MVYVDSSYKNEIFSDKVNNTISNINIIFRCNVVLK